MYCDIQDTPIVYVFVIMCIYVYCCCYVYLNKHLSIYPYNNTLLVYFLCFMIEDLLYM